MNRLSRITVSPSDLSIRWVYPLLIMWATTNPLTAQSPPLSLAQVRELVSNPGTPAASIEAVIQQFDTFAAENPGSEVRCGETLYRAGLVEASLRHFDNAVLRDPARQPYLWQRGIAQYDAGQYQAGREQFESHRLVNPHDVENATWHYLCVAALHGADEGKKALLPAPGDPRPPMDRVYDLYAGKIEPVAVLEAAQRFPDVSPEGRSARFYAYLYIALWYEAQGNVELAKTNLEAALRQERGHYMADVAEVRLARLRGAPARRAVLKETQTELRILRDLAYVPDGHERQRLDLYLPEAAAPAMPLPLVVWVHGGGWRNGRKDACPARWLVDHGFAVASINYRLSSHATFPAQIDDCKQAIRWLKTHAVEYAIDPQRIGVWGSSAGGHLAALLGTTGDASPWNDADTPTVDSRVAAVVDYFGPTDLAEMNRDAGEVGRLDHDAPDSPESKLLGGPVQQQRDAARLASPLTHATAGDPPFLIVHGDRDPLVPIAQSRKLEARLRELGVEVRLMEIPGGGHGPFREPDQLKEVESFFKEHLQ